MPRLGAVNGALVTLYFAPVWGIHSLRALTSPYAGFDDPGHAAAAAFFGTLLNVGLDGLVRTAGVLAGIKLVVAVAFVAYLIEFARALVMAREPDRETLDVLLVLAGTTVMLWAWPALRTGDTGLIRVYATQFMLLTAAAIVVVMERRCEKVGPVDRPCATTLADARSSLPIPASISASSAKA